MSFLSPRVDDMRIDGRSAYPGMSQLMLHIDQIGVISEGVDSVGMAQRMEIKFLDFGPPAPFR